MRFAPCNIHTIDVVVVEIDLVFVACVIACVSLIFLVLSVILSYTLMCFLCFLLRFLDFYFSSSSFTFALLLFIELVSSVRVYYYFFLLCACMYVESWERAKVCLWLHDVIIVNIFFFCCLHFFLFSFSPHFTLVLCIFDQPVSQKKRK